MKKIILLTVCFMFVLSGQSYASDNMTKCKNDGDCPEGYICNILPYNRAGTCLEEPKPKETIPIYTGILGPRLNFDLFLSMPIPFKDDNLKKAINKELGDPASSDITVEECMGLEKLFFPGYDLPDDEKIEDLSGIQFCFNLTHITLPYQKIDDISPIANLKKLEAIFFSDNNIESLNPIKKLSNLKELSVSKNKIELINPPLFASLPLVSLHIDKNPLKNCHFMDSLQTHLEFFSISKGDLDDSVLTDHIWDKLSPSIGALGLDGFDLSNKLGIIAGFTDLYSLRLINAGISDISDLSSLENLVFLDLSMNYISDLLPLMHLEKIQSMYLMNNEVSSIAALVAKAQGGHFSNGSAVFLHNNPISDNAFDWHVEILESFGIGVHY